MPAFNTIAPTVLMRRIGTPDCPLLIDVRIDEDYDEDPALISLSLRWPHTQAADLSAWLRHQGTRPEAGDCVVICQKGRKLSHGVAALLRCDGIDAQVLEGGMVAWRDAGLPRLTATALPLPARGSIWVTRHRPKVDRIACGWLIRRFVDPEARFFFVPTADVSDVAARFDGTTFDTPNARWTHDGDLCTFDAMLRGFGLSTDPLRTMARVIRAADTDRPDLAPEAAGLLALSIGLSRAHKSDLVQLDAGMILYDALYRWARDGQSERHGWPEGHGA